MAFTAKYIDLATLVQSNIFQSRVTGAVANYAKFIIGEATTVQFHQLRMTKFAAQAIYNPQLFAAQIYWLCAIDPAFSGQSAVPIDPSAANVNDATLDTVVQTAINNTILQF
jgi:hypothetical protein